MANELSLPLGITGQNIYFLVRNSVNQIWNGAGFENYTAGNYASYPITATEQGATGFYVGSMPSLSTGVYNIEARQRVGGSPAQSDLFMGSETMQWGNSAVWYMAQMFFDSMSNYEASAARQSLVGAILKLTSKFDAFFGRTYRTNGSTVFMTQTPTLNSSMTPVQALDVGL